MIHSNCELQSTPMDGGFGWGGRGEAKGQERVHSWPGQRKPTMEATERHRLQSRRKSLPVLSKPLLGPEAQPPHQLQLTWPHLSQPLTSVIC